MINSAHPELDLTVSRIIKAPRSAVWNAWTDPASFALVFGRRTYDAVIA